MLRFTLIYLWIYIAIHGMVQTEAGDAEEHVHIKLHMPKGNVRKLMLRNHVRHKKNPPPYRHGPPPPPHGVPPPPHASPAAPPPGAPSTSSYGPGMMSGPGHSSSGSIYHEIPHHNYLTAMGEDAHALHTEIQQHQNSNKNSMTHIHAMENTGANSHELLSSPLYTTSKGISSSSSSGSSNSNGLVDDTDYMEYLTKNFASFPKPTYETEIITTPTSDHLAYHQHHHHHGGGDEVEFDGSLNHASHEYGSIFKQRPLHDISEAAENYQHHHYPHHHYHQHHELDEDNEILGPLRETSSLRQYNNEWPRLGAAREAQATKKTLKNENLLRHVMQQQQHEQQQQLQPLYEDVDNNQDIVASMPARQKSRQHYRNDKLHKEARENYRDNDDDGGGVALDMMLNTYEDLDTETHQSEHDQSRYNEGGGGIKPLTVDDIWSQLQRTYLNKYTPQAQPNEMAEAEQHRTSSSGTTKKRKRNSQKIKIKNRHPQHNLATAASAAVRATTQQENIKDNNNNNYFNQEHQGKPSTFYDTHTPQSSSYASTSFKNISPFQFGYSTSSTNSLPSSSSSPSDYDLFNSHITSASTRPSYQNFKAFTNFDDNTANNEQNAEEETEDDTADDVSSEESSSVFSSSYNNFNNNRNHRHNHGHVAYGQADTLNNNPFNYEDLYPSYSTPIAQVTLAPNYEPSTFHPNSFHILAAAATPETKTPPSAAALLGQVKQTPQSQTHFYPSGYESTSYQWREQQHLPVSYQTYQTLSSHQQQQKRPQQQQLQQQQQPTYSHYYSQQQYQPQTSNALRLPKATVATTSQKSSSLSSSSSVSLTHPRPLATSSSPLFLTATSLSASSSPSSFSSSSSSSSLPLSQLLSTNDFTSAVKQTSIAGQQQQQQSQRNKKRKNRLKSKRNRIVVL